LKKLVSFAEKPFATASFILQLMIVASKEVDLESGKMEELDDSSGLEKLGKESMTIIANDNKHPRKTLLDFLKLKGNTDADNCCFIL